MSCLSTRTIARAEISLGCADEEGQQQIEGLTALETSQAPSTQRETKSFHGNEKDDSSSFKIASSQIWQKEKQSVNETKDWRPKHSNTEAAKQSQDPTGSQLRSRDGKMKILLGLQTTQNKATTMISSAAKTKDRTVKSEDMSQIGKTKDSDLVQENEQHIRRCKIKSFYWKPHSNLSIMR
jgi:hypothetical protein